jgi:hypothetical protein
LHAVPTSRLEDSTLDMRRAAPIAPLMGLTLLTAPAADAQVPWHLLVAPEQVAEPEVCGSLPAGALQLESAEFEIDVRLNPSAVQLGVPRQLPATEERPALRLADGLPAVPIALNQVTSLRAAHRAGALRAVLGLAEAPGPRADASCADARVDHVELYVSDVLFASAHRPVREERVQQTEVRVGPLMPEPTSPALPQEVLEEKLRFHGETCVRRTAPGRRARGSVMIEVRSRGAGVLQRPVATVDGLQRPALVFCLINSIFDDPDVARTLPEGAHFYAPFYFKPDPTSTMFTDQPRGH